MLAYTSIPVATRFQAPPPVLSVENSFQDRWMGLVGHSAGGESHAHWTVSLRDTLRPVASSKDRRRWRLVVGAAALRQQWT